MVRIASPERGIITPVGSSSTSSLDRITSGGCCGGVLRRDVAVTVGHRHQRGELAGNLRTQRVGGITPGPVAGPRRWCVHAPFAAELEDVLHGKDAHVGD